MFLCWKFGFMACSAWMIFGVASMCDTSSVITETAYVGAYEIRFPGSSIRTPGPGQCCWLISAYRKDYTIHLEFDDVVLERSSQIDGCLEEVTVYDGPKITDTTIASFCGREEPRVMTSSREALLVYSSNRTSSGNGTFRLVYKAIKERHHSGDTGEILRTGFGVFIGATACLIIFSWAFRKYKQTRPNRSVFVFGCPRINTSTVPQNRSATARTRDTIARDHIEESPAGMHQRMSFKNKFTGFFQDVVMRLAPRRMAAEPCTSTSRHNNIPHFQQQQIHHSVQHGRTNCCHGRSAILTNANISNINCSDVYSSDPFPNSHLSIATDLRDIRSGHVPFSYPIIPLSGFSSDPNAVRPPPYEECINSAHPLHLHNQKGNTFYNRAFNLKDEEPNCIQIFSPPPPYSESGQEVPSLEANSEGGVTHQSWMLPCQQPPVYTVTPSGDTDITTPDVERLELDSEAREESCDRGEMVIYVTAVQDGLTLSRPERTTNSSDVQDRCVLSHEIVQPSKTDR